MATRLNELTSNDSLARADSAPVRWAKVFSCERADFGWGDAYVEIELGLNQRKTVILKAVDIAMDPRLVPKPGDVLLFTECGHVVPMPPRQFQYIFGVNAHVS